MLTLGLLYSIYLSSEALTISMFFDVRKEDDCTERMGASMHYMYVCMYVCM